LQIGHFEHFYVLIVKDSPGKWSHTHKCDCVCTHAR